MKLTRVKITIINTAALIALATLCVLLCGCRTTRSRNTMLHTATTQATMQQATTADVWSFLNARRHDNELTETELHWRLYDTTTTDSTGAHPLLAEGGSRSTQKKRSTTEVAAADSAKHQQHTAAQVSHADSIAIEQTAEAEATPIVKHTYRLVIALCLLLLLILAVTIYIRKTLFKKP